MRAPFNCLQFRLSLWAMPSSLSKLAQVLFCTLLGLGTAQTFGLENPPELILPGKDGFAFYLLRDPDGAPARSADGYALYEGKNGDLQVNTSFGSLVKREQLLNSRPVFQSKDWAKHAIQASISTEAFARILNFFRDHPEDFRKLFSGMTPSKVDLFKGIIFERKLVLTDRSMRELSRKAFATNAPSVKVPIFIEDDWVKKHILDMITDVEGSKFSFFFRNKTIFMGPIDAKDSPTKAKKPGIRIHLAIQKAVIEGPTHDIGRIANLWNYDEAWKKSIGITQLDDLLAFFLRTIGSQERDLKKFIRFYDENDYLVKGEIENLDITVGLSFEELVRNGKPMGMWKLSIEEPLTLITDTDAKVRLWFEKRPPPVEDVPFDPHPADELDTYPDSKPYVVRLTDGAKEQIRATLSNTLSEAFRSLYFSSDLSIRVPLEAPEYQRLFSSVTDEIPLPASSIDTQLASIGLLEDGLRITFDAKLSLRRVASCVNESAAQILSRSSTEATVLKTPLSEKGWTLESRVLLPLPKDPNDPRKEAIAAEPWQPRREDGKEGESRADIFLGRSLVELANLGAYAGGLYCVSTRSTWPRAPYIPLIQFLPHRPPQLEFSSNALNVKIDGLLETSTPPLPRRIATDSDDLRFKRVDSRTVGLEGSFANDSENLVLRFDPLTNLSIDRFSSDEIDFAMRLLNLALLSENGTSSRFWSYQNLLDHWLNVDATQSSNLSIDAVQWGSEGLRVSMAAESFDFFKTLLESEKRIHELSFSRRNGGRDLIATHEGSVELQWAGVERVLLASNRSLIEEKQAPVLVSYRQRFNQGEWGTLSPLVSETQMRFFLKEPGRYEFEVYAMNRSFEWLPDPITFEVEFDPKKSILPLPTEKVVWKSPEGTTNQKSVPNIGPHPTESSKGFFGCSITSSEAASSKTPRAWWSGLLVLLAWWRHRRGLKTRIVRSVDP